MKTLILTCICAITFQQVHAQVTSGKIFYTETMKMNIDIKDEDMKGSGMTAEQFSALMPKEHAAKKVLYYNPEAALYDDVKTESTDATAQGGMQMMINFSGNQSTIYRDMKNNKMIEERDFMSRKFLITSDITKTEWKMTGKQKEIAGYPCQQATGTKDTQQVSAWFTSAIPVSAGPNGYGGLPGMILEMQVGKDITIAASKIEPGTIDTKLLAKPSEGKKVTKEQYNKIMEEKLKEMNVDMSGGGGNRIIIKTDIRH